MVPTAGKPAKAAAIEAARSRLDPVFEMSLGDDGAAHPAPLLKAAVLIEDGVEIIWVAQAARTGAEKASRPANALMHRADLAACDGVRFTAEKSLT